MPFPGTGFGPVSDVPVSDIGGAAAPAVGTPYYPSFDYLGPPMDGAPWSLDVADPIIDVNMSLMPPAPPVTGTPVVFPSFDCLGPAMDGAPWVVDALFDVSNAGQGPFTPPVHPVGPFPPFRGKTFIERLPQLKTDSDFERLRRITEKTASIFNSLIHAGQLEIVGLAEWMIVTSSGSGSGPTGTFTNSF